MISIKNLFSKNDNLGLCLSGGGALGFAHVGVLQALEELEIKPTHIVGSSMGAIIGTLYAAGYSAHEMQTMIKEDKLYKVTKLMTFKASFFRSGISDQTMLQSLLQETVPHNSFELLERKLHICVSNLSTAEWEIKSEGNQLDRWVAASASIPGVFEAILEDGAHYVDGGLLNNMPAQALANACPTIIGVDVIPYLAPTLLKNPTDTLGYSLRAVQHQNSKEGRNLCKYLIEPTAIKKHHEFNFESYQEIIKSGYKTTYEYVNAHPEMRKLAKG